MHPLAGTKRGELFSITNDETALDTSNDSSHQRVVSRKSHGILKAHYQIRGHDENLPESESWRNLPEIPSSDEILAIEDSSKPDPEPENWNDYQNDPLYDPELPFNVIDGPWPSSNSYITAHYKILREDAIGSLRRAVQIFRRNPAMMEDQDIYIYTEVTITGWYMTRQGIACRVEFCTDRSEKRIRWEESKRFTQGTIVALSHASNLFSTECKVAVVAARSIEGGLDQNPPTIDLFFGDTEQKDYVMVEAREGYFEASRHMLVSMQKLITERFPLKKYLAYLNTAIQAPQYLEKNPCLDLSSLLISGQTSSEKDLDKDKVKALSNVDVLNDFPKKIESEMDESQTRALYSMITNCLSIVQGPPGTGKTFVSVLSLRLMIQNLGPNDPPIIVAAQTNHALDQLLNHLLKFEPNIVRLGSRSARKNKEIRERTLYELHLENNFIGGGDDMGRCKRELKKIEEKLKNILDPLLSDSLLTPEQLVEYKVITEDQRKSFSALNWADDEISENEVVNWLGVDQMMGIQRASPVNLGLPLEDSFEPEQRNYLPDNDEEEDIDVNDLANGELRGIWVPYKRKFTGRHKGAVNSRKWKKRLSKIKDIYEIHENERGSAYRYFEMRVDSLMLKSFKGLLKEYQQLIHDFRIAKAMRDIKLIENLGVKLIGCTTSGLAKYRGLLSALQPRTLLIEEAAETLEGKIMAGTPESIQQLIMVGDHQQLQASCTIRPLQESPYHMRISMFERLINNDFPFVMLNKQRRMIPEIRELLCIEPRPFYKKLYDHEMVLDRIDARPHVPGMGGKDTYFFHHNWPEARNLEGSCFNEDEAEMVVEFFYYLYLNGLDVSKITILTFYRGQKSIILKMLRDHINLTGIDHFHVHTVDSYQGEENDVILLSLVRSNMPRNIGFLDNKNRLVVALSRARRGLYLFGNSVTLTTGESEDPNQGRQPLWLPLICHLASQNRFDIDDGLPLTCARHNIVTVVNEAEDLKKLAGGCTRKCDMGLLPCNHKCPLTCHVFEHDMAICCKEPCSITLVCGHVCSSTCGANCFCDICDLRDNCLSQSEDSIGEAESSDFYAESFHDTTFQIREKLKKFSSDPSEIQTSRDIFQGSSSSSERIICKDLPKKLGKMALDSDCEEKSPGSIKSQETWRNWDAKKADKKRSQHKTGNGPRTLTYSSVVFQDSHQPVVIQNGLRTIKKSQVHSVVKTSLDSED